MVVARPWDEGRAALIYRDNGRRIVLGIKHGDRTDIGRAAAKWMARAGRAMIEPEAILVPVPLHWTRLFRRKYNQAAVLARYLGRETGNRVEPDALVRIRHTSSLGGLSPDERFAAVSDAIRPHASRGDRLKGNHVILVDDVMTSGATAAAATEAAFLAGAKRVCVLHLARAVKGA
jgi:predicted amidophosphoribosyltransferase